MHTIRITVASILLLLPALFAGGCATAPASRDLPPILTQEELVRPYDTLGRIQVTREVYLLNETPGGVDAQTWGYQAIREAAAKMNADAVIFPEVSGHTTTPGMLPSITPATEYRATGVAIKFK